MRIFEKVPPLLQQGESRKEWEFRRKELVQTVAVTEYGCRPDKDYTVSWTLRSRETVLAGNAERLITDITVSTALGSHTFPLYTFLPKAAGKVPATVLICSQSRTLAPQKMPEGVSMEDLPMIFARMKIVMDGPMDMGGPRRALDMAVDMDNGHWPVPSILAREAQDVKATLAEIRRLLGPDRMLFAQATAHDSNSILEQAKALDDFIGPNFYCKIPIDFNGPFPGRTVQDQFQIRRAADVRPERHFGW